MLTDGTTIDDHLPEELYQSAVEVLTDMGQYSPMLDYFMPIVWQQTISTVMIAETGADTSLGIDRYFLNRAKEEGKEVLEVESAEFQYGMLANFSMELQILMLESTLEDYGQPEKNAEEIKTMMDLWQSGDEAAFAQYLVDSNEISEEYLQYENYESLMAEYNKAMIEDRNESMTEYAMDVLESGKEVFIVVGAAHVVGQGAMAENLRALGYTVELVQ